MKIFKEREALYEQLEKENGGPLKQHDENRLSIN